MNKARLILLTVIPLLLFGCRRNELCYEHEHGNVTLEVSWDKLPAELKDTPPESVGIMLYDGNTGYDTDAGGKRLYDYYRETYGGKLTIADGLYDYIVYNSDTQQIQFRGTENYETAEAYLIERTRIPYNPRGDNRTIYYPEESEANQTTREQVLIKEPDRLFATYNGRTQITAARDCSAQVIRAEPASRVMFIDLDITVCELQTARSYRGSLSGITRSIRLNSDESGEDTGTVIFDLQKKSETSVGHSICIFGVNQSADDVPPEEKIQHLLKLEFVMLDNQVAEFEFDIGDQLDFENPQSEEHTLIQIPCEDIELPEIEYPESGFDAGVEDWGERIDIYL